MKPTSLSQIKICIWIVITGLALSGITAFPLQTELEILVKHSAALPGEMQQWLLTIDNAIVKTNIAYPYLAYGTDWLAFAHMMLAVLFIGPLQNPIKNIWVIEFGMFACLMIVPLAFIAGSIRGIPIFWRFIDCSFGVIGIVPLAICYKRIKQLQFIKATS